MLRFLLHIGLCSLIISQEIRLPSTSRSEPDVSKNVGLDPIVKQRMEAPKPEKEKVGISVTTLGTVFLPLTTTTSLKETLGMGIPPIINHFVPSPVPPTPSTKKPDSADETTQQSPSGILQNGGVQLTPNEFTNSTGVSETFNETEVTTLMGVTPVKNEQMYTVKKGNETYVLVPRFCGYPPYSDRQSCVDLGYYTTPISECENRGGMIVFGIAVMLLGLVTIFLNCLLPIVVWRKAEMRTQYDFIKVSLSFADMITGFLLFIAVIPNMIWIRKYSEQEGVKFVEEDTNSATAIIVGSLLTMSGQASLLHLMFLSVERYIAINWPFWHLLRKTRTIIGILISLWALSFVCAFMPGAFPQYFEYKFQPVLLIHFMTQAATIGENGETVYGIHGAIYPGITMMLPYAIMLIACILTGHASYKKLTERSKRFGTTAIAHGAVGKTNRTEPPKKTGATKTAKLTSKFSMQNKIRPEISVFLTIVIMVLGFTVTIMPFGIVLVLFVAEYLRCESYTLVYVVTFYAGLANGFINPIIYSFRDKRFKTAVKELFQCDAMRTTTTKTTLTELSNNSNSRV